MAITYFSRHSGQRSDLSKSPIPSPGVAFLVSGIISEPCKVHPFAGMLFGSTLYCNPETLM